MKKKNTAKEVIDQLTNSTTLSDENKKLCTKIFLELMPDETRKVLSGTNYYENGRELKIEDAKKALAKMLCGSFTYKDGKQLSPKQLIDMSVIGYTLANPTPQNVKALYETAGLITKNVDITTNGNSIDAFLHSLDLSNNTENK